jgi:hypothetical protein
MLEYARGREIETESDVADAQSGTPALDLPGVIRTAAVALPFATEVG